MSISNVTTWSILVCLALLATATAVAQQSDCDTNKPTLDGHWTDELNGDEIIISTSSRKIVARYAEPDKTCRDPDSDGKPVPFEVDFDGYFTGSGIEGSIFWCDTLTKKGKTHTTGIGYGNLFLKVSKDLKTLSGSFHGRNGTESISFTNISKDKKFKQVVARVSSGAKIYEQASTSSRVRYTPAAGTKIVIEDVQVDASGNPAWYFVTGTTAAGVGGANSGWIPAGKVRCYPPPGPVS